MIIDEISKTTHASYNTTQLRIWMWMYLTLMGKHLALTQGYALLK